MTKDNVQAGIISFGMEGMSTVQVVKRVPRVCFSLVMVALVSGKIYPVWFGIGPSKVAM